MTNSWRNPPSNPSADQIAAVNELLQSIGQAPVSTLDTSNPDVSIAWNTLVSTSRDVQAEGWAFNRENHIQLTRSAAAGTLNYILLASNELQVDLVNDLANQHHNAVIRKDGINTILYDKEQHSKTWTYDPIVDKVFYFDWENLPIPIQSYIITRAAAICSSRITGDINQYKMLKQREDYCRAQAVEYDTNQGDYSFFGLDTHTSGYRTYQPVQSLSRY
jgi:hypothetical protein